MPSIEIETLYVRQMPRLSLRGEDQRTHEAIWEAKVNQTTSGDFVLALAQGIVGTLPAGVKAVPFSNDVLAVDSDGTIEPAIGVGTGAAWVAAGTGRYADEGALAKDFDVLPLEEGNNKNWEIRVRFRAPEGGVAFDETKWRTRFANLSTTLPTLGKYSLEAIPSTPEKLMQDVNNNADPLAEPKNFKVEYVTRQSYEHTANEVAFSSGNYAVTSIRRPVTNRFGEPYEPWPVVRKNRVVTVQLPVANGDLMAWVYEKHFGNTLNAAPFTYDGDTIPKWHAKFLGAESSDPLVQNNVTYQVLTYRVELAPPGELIESGFIRATPEWASFYRDSETTEWKVPKDADGLPTGERVPLDRNGFRASDPGHQNVTYWIYERLADYTNLLS